MRQGFRAGAGLAAAALALSAAQAAPREDALRRQGVALEDRIGSMLAAERAAAKAADEARAGYERALIALAGAEFYPDLPAGDGQRLAAMAAAGANRVKAAEAALAALRGGRTALAAERAELAVAQARADSAEAAMRAAAFGMRTAAPQPSVAAAKPGRRVKPVAGAVLAKYGRRGSRGLAIAASVGAPVLSPSSGRVAYAGAFRSYGGTLILDAGNGYAVVLTGLGKLRARVGQTVSAGQPLGEIAASATEAPALYFEVRHDGRPIDPQRWLTAAAG